MSTEKESKIEKGEEKKADVVEEAAKGPESAPLKGILGTKVGMTRIFVNDTRMVPVTVISAEGLIVSQVKSQDTDGYNAVQVAYDDVAERKLSKAEAGHFSKKGIPFKRHAFEFRVSDPAPFKVGQIVPVSVFQKGEWVQASGMTKGLGFTGAMKRYGFSGGPHSHGHGEYRRSPGSSGGQGPQNVIPGKKMPGHKGNVWQTVPHIEVVDVDSERNLVLLKGSIPGPNGNFVVLRPSTRKPKGSAVIKAAKKGKK